MRWCKIISKSTFIEYFQYVVHYANMLWVLKYDLLVSFGDRKRETCPDF
jgi:hypothetical protein